MTIVVHNIDNMNTSWPLDCQLNFNTYAKSHYMLHLRRHSFTIIEHTVSVAHDLYGEELDGAAACLNNHK